MNRRELLRGGAFVLGSSRAVAISGAEANGRPQFGNGLVSVGVSGSAAVAWWLKNEKDDSTHLFAPPIYPINGKMVPAVLRNVAAMPGPRRLTNGVVEHRFRGEFAADPEMALELVFRIAPGSPIVRVRYVLRTQSPDRRLEGPEQPRYLAFPMAGVTRVHEVQLSVFNEMFHSYTLWEHPTEGARLADTHSWLGPILVSEDAAGSAGLIAYEHGSEAPDAFLQFQRAGENDIELRGVKGNYVAGSAASDYTSIWMQAGACTGGIDRMRGHFRDFVLRWMSETAESRKPYLFYNTWNYQERNKWWNGRSYLQPMNTERILAEIDVAHRLGIEVYVMDTGWYEATGDWHVSRQRFPDGLQAIRERLGGYLMKLGLWFNPTAAAVSSTAAARYRSCVRRWRGEEGKPHPIWETEASYPMCLVSAYGDAFADTLIRVAQETGARYFKWDAIGQYGCDSPDHWHGTARNSEGERADCYAFQLPLEMARIAAKISSAFPDATVDFDVTEAGRCFGLSFLSAGKYFLINNGPYLFNYDLPIDKEKQNWNLFFYPGPARTWICRSPLTYDRWIPSILFLTHYFPDDPAASQMVNVASLILGQNGIWGDLPKVSASGVERIASVLQRYKLVRDDITSADPVRSGTPGGSPEIHEKISDASGRGAVVMFATAKGSYRYVTAHVPSRNVWTTDGAEVTFDAQGRASIRAKFDDRGAVIVFFS